MEAQDQSLDNGDPARMKRQTKGQKTRASVGRRPYVMAAGWTLVVAGRRPTDG